MLWFTVWFMVILKIPILYLAYVLWWAIKDAPEPYAEPLTQGPEGDGEGTGWRPSGKRRRPPRPRRGPHGSPARRPARTGLARARARERM